MSIFNKYFLKTIFQPVFHNVYLLLWISFNEYLLSIFFQRVSFNEDLTGSISQCLPSIIFVMNIFWKDDENDACRSNEDDDKSFSSVRSSKASKDFVHNKAPRISSRVPRPTSSTPPTTSSSGVTVPPTVKSNKRHSQTPVASVLAPKRLRNSTPIALAHLNKATIARRAGKKRSATVGSESIRSSLAAKKRLSLVLNLLVKQSRAVPDISSKKTPTESAARKGDMKTLSGRAKVGVK